MRVHRQGPNSVLHHSNHIPITSVTKNKQRNGLQFIYFNSRTYPVRNKHLRVLLERQTDQTWDQKVNRKPNRGSKSEETTKAPGVYIRVYYRYSLDHGRKNNCSTRVAVGDIQGSTALTTKNLRRNPSPQKKTAAAGGET